MADAELIEYLVVTDMVVITNPEGRVKDGEMPVYRAERGASVFAPEGNDSVAELVGMGGLVRADNVKAAMGALNRKGSVRRPTVTSDVDAESHLRYRVTAAGTATMLAGSEELPLVVEEAAPLSAENPDLSTIV